MGCEEYFKETGQTRNSLLRFTEKMEVGSSVVFLGTNNNIYTNFGINILEDHERRF